MCDEEKTVYVNNKSTPKRIKNEEETVYIGKDDMISGEETVYIGKDNVTSGEETVYIGKDNVTSGEEIVYIGKEYAASEEETEYIGRNNVVRGEGTVCVDKSVEKEAVNNPRMQTEEMPKTELMQKSTDKDEISVLYYLPENTMLQKRYRINAVLGEGGFGITYSGWDITLNIPVAIKEYYPTGLVTRNTTVGKTTQVIPILPAKYGTQFRDGIDRVLDEARRMAKFRNTQGIVGVYDFFEANSTAYIVMEYIDGCTLDVYYKNNRMDNITLFNMLVPVMDAIQLLHNEGIIHRDISPDNIMVDHDGNFKLLDFGAARGYTEESLTTISVILKKSYAPEEQFRSKGTQGPWTDVYALGATIYELITGQTPPMSIERLAEDEIIDIRKLAPSLTKGQSETIMTALAVRSKDRWQSVDEFKNALLHSTGAVAVKETDTLQSNAEDEVKESVYNKDGMKSGFKAVFGKRTTKYIATGGMLAACVFLFAVLAGQTGAKGTGYLGIMAADIPDDVTQQYDIAEGVYITEVYANTPAAEGNFAAGDIISALDSTDITSFDDFSKRMDDYDEGDEVEITVLHLDQGEYKEDIREVQLVNKNEQPPVNILVSSIDDVPDYNVESSYEDLDIKFVGAETSSDSMEHLRVYLAIYNPNPDTREVCFKQLLINGVRVDQGRGIGEIKGESEMIVTIATGYSSLLNSQIGDEMRELSVRYEYADEEDVVRECIDSGFVFHFGDSNVTRGDEGNPEEDISDKESKEGTEMNDTDDIDGADGSAGENGAVFNFVVPDYLDVKYISCENRYGYITFFYNITNKGRESRYIDFQSYGFIKGIDMRSTSEGKHNIDPGETTSIGCKFDWDEINAVGFERINNVVFKMKVKENEDAEEYLDVFNQCIRLDEEEDTWIACAFDEIDNSDVETTGTQNYSFDQQNFSVRYAGYLNQYGYITYYFHVTNHGSLPLYCRVDKYQAVNGISISSTSKGNSTIMPGTASAVGCTIDWDDVENAGIEEVQDVVLSMYEKNDKDSEEKNEFTYRIAYTNEGYVANN